MRKWTTWLILALPVGLLLAACGSGPSTEISVNMEDFQFSPMEWTVAETEEITVELTNEGSVEHEWVILKRGVTISSESELPETEEELLDDFVYREDEVEPGETKTVTFTAPLAGDYQIICAIEGHFDAGMEGILISEST